MQGDHLDAFSYLAVLISIVLGLGITQLLGGLGRWVENRRSFKLFMPAIVWTGILLLVHVQTWWSMFGLRLIPQWTFVRFAVVLLQPITLYLMAILVLPGQNAPTADLKVNYFGQRQWFFGLLAFVLLVSVSKDLIVGGSLPSGRNLGFHAAFLVSALVGLSTEREGYHKVLSILSALAMVAYIGILFAQLR